jgi:hypothetical protein
MTVAWTRPDWLDLDAPPVKVRDLVPSRFGELALLPHRATDETMTPLDLEGDPHGLRASFLELLGEGPFDAMFWNGLGERRHVVGPTVGLWGERFQHDLAARAHLVDRSAPWPQMLWRGAAPTIFVASPYD